MNSYEIFIVTIPEVKVLTRLKYENIINLRDILHWSMSLFHKAMSIVYKSSTYLHFWNLTKPLQKFKLSHLLKK